jgi:hypothetical protein
VVNVVAPKKIREHTKNKIQIFIKSNVFNRLSQKNWNRTFPWTFSWVGGVSWYSQKLLQTFFKIWVRLLQKQTLKVLTILIIAHPYPNNHHTKFVNSFWEYQYWFVASQGKVCESKCQFLSLNGNTCLSFFILLIKVLYFL